MWAMPAAVTAGRVPAAGLVAAPDPDHLAVPIYDARRLLADLAAGIGETTRIASEAHNLLSHLKLAEPPQ